MLFPPFSMLSLGGFTQSLCPLTFGWFHCLGDNGRNSEHRGRDGCLFPSSFSAGNGLDKTEFLPWSPSYVQLPIPMFLDSGCFAVFLASSLSSSLTFVNSAFIKLAFLPTLEGAICFLSGPWLKHCPEGETNCNFPHSPSATARDLISSSGFIALFLVEILCFFLIGRIDERGNDLCRLTKKWEILLFSQIHQKKRTVLEFVGSRLSFFT